MTAVVSQPHSTHAIRETAKQRLAARCAPVVSWPFLILVSKELVSTQVGYVDLKDTGEGVNRHQRRLASEAIDKSSIMKPVELSLRPQIAE